MNYSKKFISRINHECQINIVLKRLDMTDNEIELEYVKLITFEFSSQEKIIVDFDLPHKLLDCVYVCSKKEKD